MTRKLQIEKATIPIALQMIPHLRPADVDEIKASTVMPFEKVMRFGVENSVDPRVAFSEEGQPVAIFGVTRAIKNDVPQREGNPWLLGTTGLEAYSSCLLRTCRGHLRRMSEPFDYLFNFVDARNLTAIRWLSWMGFTIHDPIDWGPHDMQFHKFDMKVSHV